MRSARLAVTQKSEVKHALKILNDYYVKADKAHNSFDGAGSGIIAWYA